MLQKYEAGAALPGMEIRSSWPMEVWYIPPTPRRKVQTLMSDQDKLLMTISGQVGPVAHAKVLIDSGATHCFISPKVVDEEGELQVVQENGEAACAGSTIASIKGYAEVSPSLLAEVLGFAETLCHRPSRGRTGNNPRADMDVQSS